MSLTPDGSKHIPVDPTTIAECWLVAADYAKFPNLAKYHADANLTAFLDDYVIQACGLINQMCNRKFNLQQIDEIIPNKRLSIRDYTTFVVPNVPLITVDNIWIQVVSQFSPVDLTYLQELTAEGIIKMLPGFSIYAQTTLPSYALATSTNLWIRYTSGYDHTTIPAIVKKATAVLVDYLIGLDNLTPNVAAFRTLNYSETAAKVGEDPILTRVDQMLQSYKTMTVFAA